MRDVILITGAGGKLGHELIKALNDNVLAISSNKDSLKGILNSKDIFTIQDFIDNKIPFERVKTIIHCAFSRSQDGASLVSSIDFSRDIYNAAVKNNVPSVISISSQSVYGVYRELPSTEDGPISPMDMYGIAKYACEKLAKEIAAGTKTKITNLRLASLIGPQFSERVIYKMIDSAIKHKFIRVVGGEQIFSFLNISDAVDGIKTMLRIDSSKWANVYNLATDEIYTIIEMANQIKEVIKGVDIQIIPTETHQSIKTNPNKFLQDFNWCAKKSLKDSIEEICRSIYKSM